MIRHIVAIDNRHGIAKAGVQPWKLPDDEQYFSDMTKTHGANILVGSTTFKLFTQPLAGRRNFVLTRHPEPIEGAEVVNDLDGFLASFTEDLWIIGGSHVYKQTLAQTDELYITTIDADFDCDTFYPEFEDTFRLQSRSATKTQNYLSYTYDIYVPDKL